MKKLIFVWMALMGVSANAAVVDTLACTITLKDLKAGNQTQNSTEFEIARRSLSASPSPDVRLYAGEFKSSLDANQDDYKYSVSFRLVSSHATKEIGNGELDARHVVCPEMSYDVCKGNTCSSIASACLMGPDPFDAKYGWSKVDVVNGVPQFDPRQLPTNLTGKITYGNDNIAEYLLQCAYKGTLE